VAENSTLFQEDQTIDHAADSPGKLSRFRIHVSFLAP